MNRRDSSATTSAEPSCGWADQLSHRLIQHAARKAPPALSERLEEEWLADLSARQGPMSRVLFGFGCCWATNVIAREHYALNVSAASPAAGSTTMAAYAQHDSTFFTRRTTALVIIAGLHVAVIYALAAGLGHRIMEVIPPPMRLDFLKDPPHDTPPPPPLKVTLSEPRKMELVRTDIRIDVPTDTDAIRNVLVAPEVPSHPPALPKADPPVKRVGGGAGKGFPNSADFYPPPARRLGEQGSTIVQVCTDKEGRLTSEPTVSESSGIAHIDEGALKLAKAGSGHYRAVTENGIAVSACFPFKATFNLIR
jgi:protein TonB